MALREDLAQWQGRDGDRRQSNVKKLQRYCRTLPRSAGRSLLLDIEGSLFATGNNASHGRHFTRSRLSGCNRQCCRRCFLSRCESGDRGLCRNRCTVIAKVAFHRPPARRRGGRVALGVEVEDHVESSGTGTARTGMGGILSRSRLEARRILPIFASLAVSRSSCGAIRIQSDSADEPLKSRIVAKRMPQFDSTSASSSQFGVGQKLRTGTDIVVQVGKEPATPS